MASTSIAAGRPERESTSTSVISTSPRCSSCFGWVSSCIPCCSVKSNSRPSTSTAGLMPDNEASTSIAAGRLEREPTSKVSISTMDLVSDNEASTSTAGLMPDNVGSTSIAAGSPEREPTSKVSISTMDLISDNQASSSTAGLMPDNAGSTSIAADSPEREPTSKVSISTMDLISDNQASTSTAGPMPDNVGSTSIAAGSPEREPNSKASISNSESKGAFDEIGAPSASTSASKCTQKRCYDVFINHRGPDVKQTLATVLYTMLTGMSLSVFLDLQELEYGDCLPQAIEAAMASALLHIAIFSKSYADSPWCLAELAYMLRSGAKIIPIFYHVEPTDLRYIDQGKGMYVHAFRKHEQKGRYSLQQLQEWKKALRLVSFYTGQIIKPNEEDEMRLLKNIVSCVLKEVKNNEPLVVANHPVGLEEIVEDFKVNTLRSAQGNQDAQIVGIWGMGGSGKTTLAKELYNKKSSLMENSNFFSSFVFDVRDAATKGLLCEKQKKLLNDLGVQLGSTFDNIEEGKRNLSKGLRSVRVFIVLDDVDNMEQLDALLPTKDSLQKGSLVIVTTRVLDILKSWGNISSIYKMRQLDPLYAKQLFCWHAFKNPHPHDEFEELVEQFIKVCKGLPLSLKVFGAQLCGESRKDYWESQLHKISKILPEDIKQILKISYDTLDDEEKEMFLDTACFFIGEDISLTIEVWNGMEWSALQSWQRLLHKCLVELDNENRIKMHDHLRDLGRDIANKQSPYRLWFPQQIINVQNQERIGIQGIIATSNQIDWNKSPVKETPKMIKRIREADEFCVRIDDGKLMVNTNGGIQELKPSLISLKYLVFNGDYFNQVMGDISRQLVWLRWFQIGQRNLPSGLPLSKLRVLELYEEESYEGEHHLEELWGETDGEAPMQLRQLIISKCFKFQGFPKSIGHLKHLKKIIIIEGHSVTSLPDEFCLLHSLEHLEFCSCKELSTLPSNFGNLSNLRHLSLYYCKGLRRLPVTFKNLKLLEHLNLSGCSGLTFMSGDLNFLENITKLEYLNLSLCQHLEELPRHITNQASLRELDVSNTKIRELPDNIGQLSSLIEMTLFYVMLTSLPASLGELSSLTNLTIGNCTELKSLPESIGQLKNLQTLSILGCPISELQVLGLCNLNMIHLNDTEVCRISFSEDCCPYLEYLFLSCNHHLKEIEALPRTLNYIKLEYCEMLKNIPSFAGLASLRDLHLLGCHGIEKIEGLGNCTRLEELRVETCWEVPGIESLEHMQNLISLNLRANKGSVIGRCIQRIQNWPEGEIIICARAVPDAASLVPSLLSPDLIIHDSISNWNIDRKLELKIPSDGDAIMFCCVINCVSSQMTVRITTREIWYRGEHSVEVEKGRWAWVGVFAKSLLTETLQIRKFSFNNEECGEVEKCFLVSGAKQTTMEAARSLLPLFLQS